MKIAVALFLFFTLCLCDENLATGGDLQIQNSATLNLEQNDSVQTPVPGSAQTERNPAQPTPKEHTPAVDMSFQSFFKNAHIVVKAAMGILLLFSVMTWTIFLAKFIQFKFAFSRLKKDSLACERINSIDEVLKLDRNGFAVQLAREIKDEIKRSKTVNASLKNRVKERLELKNANLIHLAKSHTGILASIGSSAPFIGLFGTVWGIMNSFINIANSNNASLSVVAPGIAEALFATALGLSAAIPAVLIYNYFVRAGLNFNVKIDALGSRIYLIFDRQCDAA